MGWSAEEPKGGTHGWSRRRRKQVGLPCAEKRPLVAPSSIPTTPPLPPPPPLAEKISPPIATNSLLCPHSKLMQVEPTRLCRVFQSVAKFFSPDHRKRRVKGSACYTEGKANPSGRTTAREQEEPDAAPRRPPPPVGAEQPPPSGSLSLSQPPQPPPPPGDSCLLSLAAAATAFQGLRQRKAFPINCSPTLYTLLGSSADSPGPGAERGGGAGW